MPRLPEEIVKKIENEAADRSRLIAANTNDTQALHWKCGFIAGAEMIYELLSEEIEILRRYGNKDCTAMADDALQARRLQGWGSK